MVSASEDVGNADPQAMQVAVSAALAVERLGMPEARITLAQAAAYIASAPKSTVPLWQLMKQHRRSMIQETFQYLLIFRMHITNLHPDSGMGSDTNIHMIIRIIIQNCNIFRMHLLEKNSIIHPKTGMK